MATLKIKNMVCDRCIMTVRDLLETLGYEVRSIELGQVRLADNLEGDELETIASKLQEKGFELITDKNNALVEKVKSQVIEYVSALEEKEDPPKLSSYLSEKLHHNYSYLSNRFSKHSNLTIQQYLIQLKIERVKELLSYREMTLSEIAWMLKYSSVQYLSNQFKNVTGETVSSFRTHLDAADRQSLDNVS